MKVILMSIKPQWVAKILNGEKTIEVRKRFPTNYVGWVYVYCTKSGEVFKNASGQYRSYKNRSKCVYKGRLSNGVVVARFWCDKVEEIENKPFTRYGYPRTKTLDSYNLTKYSCVDNCDIKEYLAGGNGTAIHITKLDIFDKPKNISEFKHNSGRIGLRGTENGNELFNILKPVERAPQSWQFIEV